MNENMQCELFEIHSDRLTISETALIANVSISTIRNWIKTGYLIEKSKGYISKESLEIFMSEIAGKHKLNSRANKSRKIKKFKTNNQIDIDTLIESYKDEEIGIRYQKSLPESHRNKEGIYYTPSDIVRDMYKGVPIKKEYKFLDPCCGSGNFIIEAVRQGIKPENVYGYDTDANAVKITLKRLRDEFGYESKNIVIGDFLEEAGKLQTNKIKFDLIFTNPPWGKKIEKNKKEFFSNLYDCGNSLDTTSLFLGASLHLLKEEGYLGFLVQEALFNIGSFEDIRKKILSKNVIRFTDYGKAFNGLLTKAQSFVLSNKKSELDNLVECHDGKNIFKRKINSFALNPKSIINFSTNEDDSIIIKQLYSKKHITLKNRVIGGLGIMTGNNKKYCSKSEKVGYVPIYKGSDITKEGLKEPSTFILNDFSKFQQVAPLELYHSNEKIIYKFISSDLCFYCDKGQRYILNSANFFIPKNVGVTAEQLTLLLNSEIINWLFKKLFGTYKVLRGDIESLPIHIDYFLENDIFSEEKYLEYLQIIKNEDGTYNLKK
jgi:site-specific DNA-methyltransferase (adenine-specific)